MLKNFRSRPDYILLVTQMFSTIAFAVLYSTLVLFMHQRLGFSKHRANEIMGLFIAFNYGLHLLGGVVGGRYLSYRNLFVIGMVLQFGACIVFSLESQATFFMGLALYLTGAGLNVPCINMMLTQQFKPENQQRETSFIWNYAGMNVGFVVGFTVAGHFQLSHNFHTLFLLTALTSVIAASVIVFGWDAVKDHTTPLSQSTSKQPSVWLKRSIIGLAIVFLLFFALTYLLQHATLTSILILSVTALIMLFFIVCVAREPRALYKGRLKSYIIFGSAGLVFWSLYQLAPMGLTLFAQYNVNLHIGSISIAPQWLQNINSIVITVGGFLLPPLLKRIRRTRKFDLPIQFAIGLTFAGIGFAMLPIGIALANSHGYVNIFWISISYAIQSIGELLIGPIGYAMIGLLATPNLQGVMMGSWMLISGGASGVIASGLSNFALAHTDSNNPLLTNPGYSHTFILITLATGITAFLLFVLIPYLRQLIAAPEEV